MPVTEQMLDNRSNGLKILFGIVTAIVWLPIVALTNAVNILVTGVYQFGKAIWDNREDIGMAAAVLAALVIVPIIIVMRKLFKSVFNVLIRSWVDPLLRGNEFSFSRLLGSILNIVTVGLFALIKIIYKAITGYSSRFGHPDYAAFVDSNATAEAESVNYATARAAFNDMIIAAKLGEPVFAVDGDHPTSVFSRTFSSLMRSTGFRNGKERALKQFHNAFEAYANETSRAGGVDKRQLVVNKASFFGSTQCQAVRNAILADNEGYDMDQAWVNRFENRIFVRDEDPRPVAAEDGPRLARNPMPLPAVDDEADKLDSADPVAVTNPSRQVATAPSADDMADNGAGALPTASPSFT
jgi:hypothetical protein